MKRSAISGTSHLTTMVMVLSTRILRNKTTTEVRFYLAPSSQRKSAEAGTLQDEFEDKARYRRPGEWFSSQKPGRQCPRGDAP